ncbi:purine catabolism regulator [Actinocorallia herbida]|uniref:Purine catabolism regulator n=1 Tax=Actinocorallia herbida TaxID=58109 RepID=A0A3N1D156_9ACTN|nr:PucR family transcriptional regulator ligand-binding domain-containing protein [Actinocorallia herbida]ROO87240.1 purine catabolism regulator [Actinocorallia herbida]
MDGRPGDHSRLTDPTRPAFPAVESLPTVAEVLEFPSLREGRPKVVAGAAGLTRQVRWVHVSELPSIAPMLRGGELILTTGIALPSDDASLVRFVDELAGIGAAGIVVGLGPRFRDSVPQAMRAAAERHGLPLVALLRTTRFVEVTEDVHWRILENRIDELRASEQIHQIFNELTVEGAEPTDVLHQVVRMAQRPAVLENLAHQVLAYDTAGRAADTVLDQWEARSRAVQADTRTAYDAGNGWLTSTVGARGQDWGRLVLTSVPAPLPRLTMLVERAASTLAVGRLVARDEETLALHTHRTLLSGLLSPKRTSAEIAAEARAIGVPLEGRRLVPVVLTTRDSLPGNARARQAVLRTAAGVATDAVRDTRLLALVGPVEDTVIGILLSLGVGDDPQAAVERLAQRVHRGDPEGSGYVLAVGDVLSSVSEVRGVLLGAMQVADAASRTGERRLFYRLSDLRLRGLLQLMRDDARLQVFAEGELRPLLLHDEKHGTDLLHLLRTYLDSGRNKTAAAEAAHVSRAWMYERLARISTILDVDLDSDDVCTSLSVALMALDAMRDQHPPGS